MPSDESKGSQLDAIGSLAQRQLDNTLWTTLKESAGYVFGAKIAESMESMTYLYLCTKATPCCCAGRYHLHLVTSAGCSVRYYTSWPD